MNDTLIQVAIGNLSRDPNQPRKQFELASIKELAISIAAQGIIQPIIIRPNPSKEGHFYIVAGERRYRAAKRAKLTQIPAIVKTDVGAELRSIQLNENFHREDLSLIEIAEGVEAHIAATLKATGKKKVTNKELVKEFGNSETYWSRVRKLATAPQQVKDALRSKKLVNINVASDMTTLNELNENAFRDVWNDYEQGNINGSLENYVSMQVRMAKQMKEYGFVMPTPNANGVYDKNEPHAVVKEFAEDAIKAEVVVLQVDKSKFATSYCRELFTSYLGSPLSVCTRSAYKTEGEALADMFVQLGQTVVSDIERHVNGSQTDVNRFYGASMKRLVAWINDELKAAGSDVTFSMPAKPEKAPTQTTQESADNATETHEKPLNVETPVSVSMDEVVPVNLEAEIAELQKAASNTENVSELMTITVPMKLQPLISRLVSYYYGVSEAMSPEVGFAQIEKSVTELTGAVKNVH
ncbi:ParB/RepB/Spo0J family partition protein [Vibrio vulnificus]|uniref:ParB/RepB/Spo0J family partition protein n=1 Tax=Vibrio vulnificus TaxID=672 RepID=UPI0032ECBA04